MAPFQHLRRQDVNLAATLGKKVPPINHTPKVGGSEAVFIVLVILLAIIVIAASAGIYYLLRYGEPSAAERTVRRRYSIRGHGRRSHPLPIGIPSSFSDKISNVFKGRRAGRGWVPARDEEDEWDTRDEPLRERENVSQQFHHDGESEPRQRQFDEFPRVGSASASYHATLTEPSEDGQLSRSASHVDPDETFSSSSLGRDVQVHSAPNAEPEEGWLNAVDYTTRPNTTVVGGSGSPTPMVNFAPQPRRADSGQDIPLFAGTTPFR